MSETLPRPIRDRSKEYTLKCPTGQLFEVTAQLVALAQPRGRSEAHDFHKHSDRWLITVFSAPGLLQGRAGEMSFDYWTGTGCRVKRRFSDDIVPAHPDAASILYTIGSDYQTALDMPAGDAAAMDHLQSEFGHEGKASDLMRMVTSLREQETKVITLCKAVGVDPAAFAEWAASLDN